MHRRSIYHPLIVGLAVLTVTALGWHARAQNPPSQNLPSQQASFDLHLVLAVDVSWSMDPDEQRLQRDGYVEAFRDPGVIRAIQSGPARRIAVTYFEWAGAESHRLIVPWTVIDGAAAANRLADQLAAREISRLSMTSISSALQYAWWLLAKAPGKAARQVVDISGDGPNNAGPSPVTMIREEMVGEGIVINGLPILLKPDDPGSYGFGLDIPDLDIYYQRCVIGGPGSFMIPIRKREEFASATRQKLTQEISALDVPLVHRTQLAPRQGPAELPPYDCEVGERNWRHYYLDRGRF